MGEKGQQEIDQIKATGVITVKRGTTLADLIDRYVEELEHIKRWGRTKSADLKRLKKDLGHLKAAQLTAAHLTHYFTRRRNEGAVASSSAHRSATCGPC